VSTWVLLGGLAQHPFKRFNQIAMCLLWMFAVLGVATVMWYLHGTILRKRRAMLMNKNAIIQIHRDLENVPGNIKANDKPQQSVMNAEAANVDRREEREPSGNLTHLQSEKKLVSSLVVEREMTSGQEGNDSHVLSVNTVAPNTNHDNDNALTADEAISDSSVLVVNSFG
jgi:hypothetical protein